MDTHVIYIFLFVQFSVVFCKESACPNSPNCDCTEIAKKISIECPWLKKLSQLNRTFKVDLNYKRVSVLKLTRCSATTIPSKVFSNASINLIQSTCPFEEMDDNALSSIESLTELQFQSTKFYRIPVAIGVLWGLKTLQIIDGRLKEIFNETQNMTELMKLSLKNNKILHVSKHAFVGNKFLEVINLSENQLSYLDPGTFDACSDLQRIFLQNNKLKSVNGLFTRSSLQEINLRHNELESIEDAFEHKMELKILNLGENPLKDVTERAFSTNIENLQTLLFDKCKMKQLSPNLLQSLDKLRTVDLSFNSLDEIPDGFFHNLINLTEVSLSGNKIRSIDGIFNENHRLENLVLSGNLIDACGSQFHNMQYLKSIDLRRNHLQVLTNSDFSTAPSITQLLLSKNNIYRIDSDAFIHLKQLQNLTLDFNTIVSLNGSVRNIPDLKLLFLHSNRLNVIGESEMLNLSNLERLNLGNNNLSNVHGAFRNLVSLTVLTISQNKLTTLSKSTFPDQTRLKRIYSSANKWICDCRLSWLREWMTSKKLLGGHPFQCFAPPRFRTKTLGQLTPYDLLSWPEKCSPSCECTCVAEDMKFFVRVDCANRGLTEVPSELPEAIGELELQDNSLSNPIKLNISSSILLKSLNMERNFIKEIDFYLPKNIQILKLAGNNLTRFLSYFPPSITTWTLSDNPWICDCEALPFRKWMQSQKGGILDINSTRCSYEEGREETRGRIIIELGETQICPERIQLYISLAAGVVLAAGIAISSHLVYTRYRYHLKVWLYSRGFRWLKRRDERDLGKLHDAYLSFSDEDLSFVREFILPELEEKEPYYSLFVPPRDMQAGKFEIDHEMQEVTNSKRTIILLSKNYVDNEFCMEIFRVAFASCLEERLYRIILVVLGELPPLSELDPSLKVAIESTKCLRFGQQLFWEMVRYAMPDKEPGRNVDGCESDTDVLLLSSW